MMQFKETQSTYIAEELRLKFRFDLGLWLVASTIVGSLIASAETLPDRPPTQVRKPNVLMIMVDDLAIRLGCYGDPIVQTPVIDRLAKESVLFERAYCSVPVCGASRASLLTGLLPTRERFTRFDSRADVDAPHAVTLPAWFRSKGYATVSNGKIFHARDDSAASSWSPKTWRPSVSHMQANDPQSSRFRGGLRDRGPFFESADVDDDAYHDGLVAKKTVADLRKFQHLKKPFFLACGFIRPHLPFYAPQRYWDLYDPSGVPLADYRQRPIDAPGSLRGSGEIRYYSPRGLQYNSENWHRTSVHGYYACVSYIDTQIGRVLDALQQFGHANDTIVILVSDHGFHLGDHDFWGKLTLLRHTCHVPLLLRVPESIESSEQKSVLKSPPPATPPRVDAVVSLVDLYPTLCDLASLPKPTHLQGQSLVSHFVKDPPVASESSAYIRIANGDTVVTQRHMFTRYQTNGPDDEIMLFDLESDPNETRNIAGEPSASEIVAKLTQTLQSYQTTVSQSNDRSFSDDSSSREITGDNRTKPND